MKAKLIINMIKFVCIILISFGLSISAFAQTNSNSNTSPQDLTQTIEPTPEQSPKKNADSKLRTLKPQPEEKKLDNPPRGCLKCQEWCKTNYPNSQASCNVKHCSDCEQAN